MLKKLLIIIIACLGLFTSCRKANRKSEKLKTSESINVPAGFTWQNSRNINFSVSVVNLLSPTKTHLISVYDGDPDAGGTLLAKGSAITTNSFKAKVYLSNRITSIYILCAFPDGTKRLKKIPVGVLDITTTFGS